MFATLFNKYKYIALAVLFVIYSVGVWSVSSRLTDNGYLRTALNRSEEIIALKVENEKIVRELSASLLSSLHLQEEEAKRHKKELEDALKDPRYTQCTTTDSVRELYRKRVNKAK